MKPTLMQPVLDFIRAQAHGDRYGAYCRNRLMELLESDAKLASPDSVPATMEAAILDLIENEARLLLGDRGVVERLPLAGSGGPARASLLVCLEADAGGSAGPGLLFVAPLEVPGSPLTPRGAADRVFGRGAAGSRSQIAMALAGTKLLAELKDQLGVAPQIPLAWCFIAGGIFDDVAARSIAADARFRDWSTVVLAPTDGSPQKAQPGLVSFRCAITGPAALEQFPFVVRAVEIEGARLRAESVAAGMPADCAEAAVQTGHGTLGGYGSHPALACERIAALVGIRAKANPERIAMRMTEVLDATLAERLRHRVDLTRQNDPVTGEPKLKRHYALRLVPAPDELRYRIEVFGHGAWSGAAAEADSAIAKAAFLFGALIRIRHNFPDVRASATLADPQPAGAVDELLIRGVQTFLAPHNSAAVRSRLAAAAQAGIAEGRQVTGKAGADVRMDFDAPDREPLSPRTGPEAGAAEAFVAAVRLIADRAPGPSIWPGASCADVFAGAKQPPVIFGPGQLDRFGTAHECIDIPDLQRSLAVAVAASLLCAPAGSPA